jgi:hypothetical protein
MTAKFSPMRATAWATRRGSSVSYSFGLAVWIWQNGQARVQFSPPIRKVASRASQHS